MGWSVIGADEMARMRAYKANGGDIKEYYRNQRIEKKTEERILALIKDKAYRQNVNARSLRTQKSQTIGVVLPDVSNEFFAKIVQAIEKQAIKYNYSVFICNTDENMEIERRHLSNLAGQLVDGIIYIGGEFQIEKNEELRKIPMIYIDRSIFIYCFNRQ